MARKQDGTEGESVSGSVVAATEASVRQAAATAGVVGQTLAAQQRQGERATVLGHGAIPEVKLGPVEVQGEGVRLDPAQVAPVVADATERLPVGRDPDAPDEQPKERKHFVVLEAKSFLDKTSGSRTIIRAGKVIHDGHYDIAHLLRQGVKLKRVPAPETASDEMIDALTQ